MAQTTAGVKFKWAAGTGSDTHPTSWTHIPGFTDIPEVGGEAETFETTTLDNEEYKTYIPGLKDLGGALGLTANDSPEFRKEWGDFVEASKSEDGAWVAIEVPTPINQQLVFKAEGTPLGFGGAAVNGVLTTTAYMTPLNEPKWEDIPDSNVEP